MQKTISNKLAQFFGLASLVGLLVILPVANVSAASVSLSLSSSASSVQKGATFKVTLRANTSGTVSDVKARVNYDQSKLSLTNTSYSGTPLNSEGIEQSRGTGYYTVHRMKLGEPFPSGNFKVVQFTFKALASSGSTTLTVSGEGANTSVGNADDGTNHSPVNVQGVKVTLKPTPTADEPVDSGTNLPASDGNAGRSGSSGDSNAETVTSKDELDKAEQDIAAAAVDIDTTLASQRTDAEPKNPLTLLVAALSVLSIVSVGLLGYFVIKFIALKSATQSGRVVGGSFGSSEGTKVNPIDRVPTPPPAPTGSVIKPNKKD